MKSYVHLLLLCFVLLPTLAHIAVADTGWRFSRLPEPASIRGMSCPSDDVIWCAGSKKSVFYSQDAGANWSSIGTGLPLNEDTEIRSIHAFDTAKAVIATAGQPAKIFRTTDAGENWSEVFHLNGESAFIDGLQFSGDFGCAFSDPINGRIPVLVSNDAGESWRVLPESAQPIAVKGEAGFAASNSSILVFKNSCFIGTGGVESLSSRMHRLEFSDSITLTVDSEIYSVPLPSSASEGIFSLAVQSVRDSNEAVQKGHAIKMVAVGGDYSSADDDYPTAVFSIDGGREWRVAEQPPLVFQSCVVFVPLANQRSGFFLSTGKGQMFASSDGSVWQRIDLPMDLTNELDDQGFHVLNVDTRRVFAAGANGQFGMIEIEHLMKMLTDS